MLVIMLNFKYTNKDKQIYKNNPFSLKQNEEKARIRREKLKGKN